MDSEIELNKEDVELIVSALDQIPLPALNYESPTRRLALDQRVEQIKNKLKIKYGYEPKK